MGEAHGSFARELKAVTSKVNISPHAASPTSLCIQAVSNAAKKELTVKAGATKTKTSIKDLAKNAPDIRRLSPEIAAASGKEVAAVC